MEQLILITITDKGEVNEVARVYFNENHGKTKNKEIIRRHLKRILGLLFGKQVKVYYTFKEVSNEKHQN
jgi:uncharacterized membrane protein